MKQSWFGTSSYCSKLGVLYSDNSMDKIIKAKKISQMNSNKLLDEFSKVNSSLTLHRELNSRVDLYSKELKSYLASVALLEYEEARMQAAASVIQKHIRGFLARLKFSPLLVEVHKRLNSKYVQDLQANSNNCLFNFGKNLQLATKRIQKAVRRLLFRLKLKRFEQYYEAIMFQRDKLKLEKLIKLSFVLFSRFQLNHSRFLRDRERKLKRIRRKVAILLIKKVVAREKIQLKNLKVSIRKYKRRITMGLVHNKQDTEKTNEDDKDSNHTEDEIKLARMRKMIELEEAKRKKIKLGKISYKVPKLKYFKLSSRLKREDSQESDTRLPKAVVNETVKLPRFTPEPIVKSKFNKYSNLKSNYMALTESFNSAIRGPAWLSETEPERPKITLNKLRNTIYMPTQFSVQKIKEKKQFSKSQKPGWCSNPMVQDCYVPSVFSPDEERHVRVEGEKKGRPKKWEAKVKNNTRTVYERRFVENLPFTPVSSRFEEALPDLSRLAKLYPRDKVVKGTQVLGK